MNIGYLADDISFSCLKKDVYSYSFKAFRSDAYAALSVAFLALPQAMACAMLAGLPLQCGLLGAIYSSLIVALFGSSRHLVTGPTNAIALLIQAGTSEILFTYYRDLPDPERNVLAIQILTQISFLTALMQLFASYFKLGRLTQFVSHSVIVGYISGTACAIVSSQLFVLLGIERPSGVHSIYENSAYLLRHLNQVDWLTAFFGLSSLSLLVILKRKKKLPGSLIMLVGVSVVAEILGLTSYSGSSILSPFFGDEGLPNVLVIGDTVDVYGVIPDLELPEFNMRILNGVLPVAFAIALLSMMDSSAVAKSIAANSGQRLSLNQEVLGLGLGNLTSALIGAMPVSGSPSRSGLNYNAGAQTRFAAILNALFLGIFVFILDFLVERIPVSALAAVLILTAGGIINRKHLVICLRATNADATVFWVTFGGCLFLSLDVAFYLGVILSIIFYLKKSAVPLLVEYEIDTSGNLKKLTHEKTFEHRAIRLIKIEGELFFAAADLFQITLKSIAEDDTTTRVIILQLKNARDLDATACLALHNLHDFLKMSNRYLVICGITPHIWEVLNHSSLVKQLGKENLFLFDERYPNLHMHKAHTWAKKLCESVSLEKKGSSEESSVSENFLHAQQLEPV